jgi:hypothetical protein
LLGSHRPHIGGQLQWSGTRRGVSQSCSTCRDTGLDSVCAATYITACSYVHHSVQPRKSQRAATYITACSYLHHSMQPRTSQHAATYITACSHVHHSVQLCTSQHAATYLHHSVQLRTSQCAATYITACSYVHHSVQLRTSQQSINAGTSISRLVAKNLTCRRQNSAITQQANQGTSGPCAALGHTLGQHIHPSQLSAMCMGSSRWCRCMCQHSTNGIPLTPIM